MIRLDGGITGGDVATKGQLIGNSSQLQLDILTIGLILNALKSLAELRAGIDIIASVKGILAGFPVLLVNSGLLRSRRGRIRGGWDINRWGGAIRLRGRRNRYIRYRWDIRDIGRSLGILPAAPTDPEDHNNKQYHNGCNYTDYRDGYAKTTGTP